ncbi:hypothetical protein WN51_04703 [Melipona quadrifasciata]|uniref:Uncharacterized protein n=1 Tax=Melipona quadrifasciata TaxID=166423 RepID=A0A0N0BKN2_9HYME|nr:hypothetical protein WN51_04703 [Melipona quadrifasciata]
MPPDVLSHRSTKHIWIVLCKFLLFRIDSKFDERIRQVKLRINIVIRRISKKGNSRSYAESRIT